MRISELIGRRVVDERGDEVGLVHDLRFGSPRRGPERSFEVTGLVVGPGGPLSRAAHAWGYAEGRADGPVLLRLLTRPAVRDSRFVPAERVLDWRAESLNLDCPREALDQPADRTSDE